MEKQNTQLEHNKLKENLLLSNRKSLKLEGIIEIVNSCETLINVKLKDTNLLVNGSNMHIIRLDVENGILEIDGLIECIKYGKSTNIFKRMFKWKFLMSCN